MQALRIHEFGAPDRAVLQPVALRDPGPGEAAVRIEAASVNPLDLKILTGAMQSVFPVELPYTLGTDMSGVVESVGTGVTSVRPGDRVVGRLEPTAGGAFAEHALVPATALCVLPPEIPHEQAAALPTAAGTAWQALFKVGQLMPGQRVLIHAAAGGVGSFAVQLAKRAGAQVVATASARNQALVRDLGADQVLDYRDAAFWEGLQGLDLVLDTVGGDTLARSWQVLGPGGTLLSIVDPNVAARGSSQAQFVFFRHEPDVLNRVLAAVQTGELKVVLDSLHPLDRAGAALQRVAGRHARGKVIVRPTETGA
ncbi:NADP-dependent oxidoreductase [Caldimonas brevitalea]|uniref:Alcohol dehydrogenase n=1 Tax=Caldimonas brevitalea TaxID=413882 RepID=A0A0G3BUF9_9BURK|nr:NADP-dependent oxidoreductase [Caldimonas brevitalea]AKJ30170.1 alcohol dehydrogenase [Caldimonas brevitalea]